MTWRDIPDVSVQAFAPVTARLMRALRDCSHVAHVQMFGGCMPAPFVLAKSYGDPGTDGSTWFTLGSLAIFTDAAHVGRPGVDEFELSLQAFIPEIADAPFGSITWRISNGTVFSPELQLFFGIGVGDVQADFKVRDVIDPAERTVWVVEAKFNIGGGSGGATASFQCRPGLDNGSYVRCL